MIESGLYVGTLRHRRYTPVPHVFTYRTAMALLDVDRIPDLMAVSRLTSHNRWNWASFDDRDHLGDPAAPLRLRVLADARDAGLDLPDGPILLLTHLRYLGYCFNPVSFFYVFDRSAMLRFVLAEVNNTAGGSHRYWLQPDDEGASTFRASTRKTMTVSPFMADDLRYRFLFTSPADRLVAHIEAGPAGAGLVLDATLSLDRRPWNRVEIRRQLLEHPVMTAKVTAGIHWQALRLWWKGVPVVSVPRA